MRLGGLPLAYRSPYLFRLRPAFVQVRACAAMQQHVAVGRLPANSPVTLRLSRVLEAMRRVREKGCNAFPGFRSTDEEPDDLGQAFSRIPQDLGIVVQIVFRVIVLGSARKLNPLIRGEIYHIGRELLVNAFRHSRAACIEVELEYGPRCFRIVVRDDGRGIDPQVLHAGREGDSGLTGMRKRAERVGARFTAWSSAAAGTEVALSVPNSIAFEPNGQ